MKEGTSEEVSLIFSLSLLLRERKFISCFTSFKKRDERKKSKDSKPTEFTIRFNSSGKNREETNKIALPSSSKKEKKGAKQLSR